MCGVHHVRIDDMLRERVIYLTEQKNKTNASSSRTDKNISQKPLESNPVCLPKDVREQVCTAHHG